ncbi:MAG: c-type cytochrome [Pseudomonadota bacterium]
MDTMTIVKYASSFFGALLLFLVVQSGAVSIYSVDEHHGDDHADAYPIEVASADEAPEEPAEPEVPFAEVYAAADPGSGERLWNQCRACHQLAPGENGVGPYLHGLIGRQVAAADGYDYSDALAEKDEAWEPEVLSAFLADPSGWAPGTKMSYNGMSDVEDRANLIAYIATFE